VKSSSDRAKDQALGSGMSFRVRAKIVSGIGVGDVIIARWRE
jgi:hypothetical protein